MTIPSDQTNPDASTAKVASTSISEVDHKTAQRYLDIARSAISQTSTVAILWLGAILVIWCSIEQEMKPLRVQLGNAAKAYINAKNEVHRVSQQPGFDVLESLGKEQQSPHSQNGELDNQLRRNQAITRSSTAEDKAREICKGIDCFRERENEKQADYVEVQKASKVEFPLPGFAKFNASIDIAPLLLDGIILLLAGYMNFMRERVFRYLSKALRILKQDPLTTLNKYGDVLAPRPWWIAPLPRKSGECVLSEEFAFSLGWSSHKEASGAVVVLFWLALLLIQLRLVISGESILSDIGKYKEFASEWYLLDPTVVLGLYWAFFGMTLSLAARWFRCTSVADELLQPQKEISQSRRAFLINATMGIALALVITNNLPERLREALYLRSFKGSIKRSVKMSPRYRDKRVPVETRALKDGLLLNPRSRVVHAVSHGNVVGLSYRAGYEQKPQVEKWTLLSEHDIQALTASPTVENSTVRLHRKRTASTVRQISHLRENKRHISIITELAFQSALHKKQYQISLDVMIRGMKQDFAVKRNAGRARLVNATTGEPIKSLRRKPRKRHKLNMDTPQVLTDQEERKVLRVPRVSFRLYDSLTKASIVVGRPIWIERMEKLVKQYKLTKSLDFRKRSRTTVNGT